MVRAFNPGSLGACTHRHTKLKTMGWRHSLAGEVLAEHTWSTGFNSPKLHKQTQQHTSEASALGGRGRRLFKVTLSLVSVRPAYFERPETASNSTITIVLYWTSLSEWERKPNVTMPSSKIVFKNQNVGGSFYIFTKANMRNLMDQTWNDHPPDQQGYLPT